MIKKKIQTTLHKKNKLWFKILNNNYCREAEGEIMPKAPKLVRLQKLISQCGITSRRRAEEYIAQGRVEVNGKVAQEMGTKVDPQIDHVCVDGEALNLSEVEKLYVVLNKPRGYITALSDPEGRPVVIDLIKEFSERLYPVGRLDFNSEGLLILTNDGDFAQNVIHPSNNVEKVYEVKVFGVITQDLLRKLRSGVSDEFGTLKPKSVRVVGTLARKTWIEFRLTEGKNREIRRICEGHGLSIDKLRRVAIGGLSINNLSTGRYQTYSRNALVKLIGREYKANIYVSPKSSVKMSERKIKFALKDAKVKRADDQVFSMFKKGNYQNTMKIVKKTKMLKDAAKNKKVIVKEEVAEIPTVALD
jgi:23S rRNA pseudouridine2605 synthase